MPLIATKTLFEMNTVYGVSFGTLFLIVWVVRMLTASNDGRTRMWGSSWFSGSDDPSKPVDWQKHWAEQEALKKSGKTKDDLWQEKWNEQMRRSKR